MQTTNHNNILFDDLAIIKSLQGAGHSGALSLSYNDCTDNYNDCTDNNNDRDNRYKAVTTGNLPPATITNAINDCRN